MLLVVVLAVVLMAATPAFAQGVGGAAARDTLAAHNVSCSDIRAAVGKLEQHFDVSAASVSSKAAVGNVLQDLGITKTQVNACLGIAGGTPTPTPSATASASPTASATASAGSASVAVLPDTGGASLFALGVGVALIAGGVIARRIVR